MEPAAAAALLRARRHRPRMAHVFLKDHISGHHSRLRNLRSAVGKKGRWAKKKGGDGAICHSALRGGLGEPPCIYNAQGHRQGSLPTSDPRFHGHGTDVDMELQRVLGRSLGRDGGAAAMEIGACPRKAHAATAHNLVVAELCRPFLGWSRRGRRVHCNQGKMVSGRGPGRGSSCKVPDGDPAPLRGGPTGAVGRGCRFDEKGHFVRRGRDERGAVHGPGAGSRCDATTRQRHLVIRSDGSMQPVVCHPRNDIRHNMASAPATEHHCVGCQACLGACSESETWAGAV
jgi:hypothetical protein